MDALMRTARIDGSRSDAWISGLHDPVRREAVVAHAHVRLELHVTAPLLRVDRMQ